MEDGIDQQWPEEAERPRRPVRHPPAFNVPGVILALVVAFAAVHALRTLLLGDVANTRVLVDFAFIPGCYGSLDAVCRFRAAGAGIWTPLTYAFLHGSWTHFGVNAIWLLAFGTPVARRFGPPRFLLFSALGAVAGAAVFYFMNPALVAPMIGASGIVSALMGGACRFAFSGPAGGLMPMNPRQPRASVREALTNRTVLIFIIVFFASNLALIGSLGGLVAGGSDVAWQAHLGGFAFGFFGFPLFDPVTLRQER
ncbi:rhomboid family intramembrane serine protease [Jiella sp. M17.18]|uniref:rhomboid family intramembrane serine protease n=1 Tax=Jiella sp. M17.18 TaxID=3234247 RepID=UPI0034E01933